MVGKLGDDKRANEWMFYLTRIIHGGIIRWIRIDSSVI